MSGNPVYEDGFKSLLAERLSRFERQSLAAAGRRRAAVALVVLPGTRRRATVVLTVRAAGLERHGGQWAFPGGRLDPGEDAAGGALRELGEEVGLKLDRAHILGHLDDFATRSGFVITPVVVWGDAAQELVADPGEVAQIHRVALEEAARRDNLMLCEIDESDRPVLALRLLGTVIFTPTAAILHQFAELAVHDRITRVAHYEQPLFAWS